MAWTDTPIDTTQSVSQQTTRINGNAAYISTTMSVNHYFDESANEDGHHGYVQFVPEAATPADPAGDTKLGLYCLQKTAGEAVDVQPYVAFLKDASSNVLELLGIRAFGVWDQKKTNGAVTLQYAHNCTVSRDGTGIYTVTFTTDLPSPNYAVLGGVMVDTNDASISGTKLGGIVSVRPSSVSVDTVPPASPASPKQVGSCQLYTTLIASSGRGLHDAWQTWFIAFGG